MMLIALAATFWIERHTAGLLNLIAVMWCCIILCLGQKSHKMYNMEWWPQSFCKTVTDDYVLWFLLYFFFSGSEASMSMCRHVLYM